MIIEVSIGDGPPRSYRIRRRDDRLVVTELGDSVGNPGDENRRRETIVDWRRPQAGVYSLLVDDTSYEVFVEGDKDDLSIHLMNRNFKARAADARRRSGGAEAAAADGQIRITAPIPGRVSRVLVEPGQRVARGEGLIVLEAMKMENELRAPRDGVVARIEVEEGQGVEGGALLATIE